MVDKELNYIKRRLIFRFKSCLVISFLLKTEYIVGLWHVKVYCRWCHEHGWGYKNMFYTARNTFWWSFQVCIVLYLLKIDFYCMLLLSNDFTGTKRCGIHKYISSCNVLIVHISCLVVIVICSSTSWVCVH